MSRKKKYEDDDFDSQQEDKQNIVYVYPSPLQIIGAKVLAKEITRRIKKKWFDK